MQMFFCNPQMPRAAAQETFGFAPNHSPAAIFDFHCAVGIAVSRKTSPHSVSRSLRGTNIPPLESSGKDV